MKYSISATLICLVTLLSGCVNFPGQQEFRETKPFDALIVGGLADVYISQSDKQAVNVHASGMPISDVITEVQDGTLTVTTQGYHSGESVQVFVSYKNLTSIKTSGSATLTGENQLVSDEVNIITSDAGDIVDLSIKAKALTVQINDSGNANLNLDVDSTTIEMNDAGDLSIKGFSRQQQLVSNSSRGSLNNAKLKTSLN